jgi:hypothetical protein
MKLPGGTRTLTVILSAAKDLMPVANGDEVLRFAQDDKSYFFVPSTTSASRAARRPEA